ncbi:tyrosine-type recombinase/integrase [Haloarchaeobius sp. TZWSO28]|uniref:tyrosine-type recombinase/integrase n=1 Tax=Haloarchaeobius sp. TZWSO28 TaxID=3446119 RepID=UPI003EB6EBBF
MDDKLQSISPEEAVEWYLETRKSEVTDTTLKAHEYRLSHFVRWCGEVEHIEDLNDLSGVHFNGYKIWRRDDGDLNNVSLATQLSTLRVFIKWAESIDAVPRGLHDYISVPTMAPKEDVRSVFLKDDEAADIQRHLQKFEYASRNHAVFALLWHTGMRTGSLRALDLEDYDSETRSIEVRHRPEEGTPLKNGIMGERHIGLKDDVDTILSDYIEHTRISTTDEYGRSPIFTTAQGRLAKTTIRNLIYSVTRPCEYLGTCPHNREIESCEATQEVHDSSKCPSSVSPHAIRKGAITWARLNDIPVNAVSERMDVSQEVLKKHYDQRTKDEEMESRRDYFDQL